MNKLSIYCMFLFCSLSLPPAVQSLHSVHYWNVAHLNRKVVVSWVSIVTYINLVCFEQFSIQYTSLVLWRNQLDQPRPTIEPCLSRFHQCHHFTLASNFSEHHHMCYCMSHGFGVFGLMRCASFNCPNDQTVTTPRGFSDWKENKQIRQCAN